MARLTDRARRRKTAAVPSLCRCVPRGCGCRPAGASVSGNGRRNGRRIRVTQVGEVGDVAAGACVDEQCHGTSGNGVSDNSPPGVRTCRHSGRRPASSSACEPCSAMCPSARTTMRSAMRTVEKRCEMRSAILPAVSSAKRWNTSYSDRASSAAVGSSSISSCASRRYARASATFCHSPPDRSTPPSKRRPSSWSYPSGRREMTSCARLLRAASSISSSSRRALHAADGDVLPRGHLVAHEVLEDDADLAVQILDVVLAQVDAVEQNAARRSGRTAARAASPASSCPGRCRRRARSRSPMTNAQVRRDRGRAAGCPDRGTTRPRTRSRRVSDAAREWRRASTGPWAAR